MLRRDFLKAGTGAVVAGSALAGLAACGPKAGPSDTINIVSTSGTTSLVLTALMEDVGYLGEFGVKSNFINVADGNKVAAALISGHADLCPSAGFTQVLAAIGRGAPLRLVGGGAVKNFNCVFSGKPGIKTLKDLEGKSVGVGALGTQLHQTMIALFDKYGVDASKVTFANVGASTDVFKAIKAGVIDAGPCEYWLQDDDVHILENGKTFESIPEFVNQAGFTSQFTIAQKRDLLVKTLAAYAKLYRFIMTGDSEAAFVAASARALGERADPRSAHAQWAFYRQIQPYAAHLELPEQSLRYMQDLNIKTGTQKTLLPYSRVIDGSLAADAMKLLPA